MTRSTQFKVVPDNGYMVIDPIKSKEFNVTELATVDDGKEHIATGEVIAVSDYAGLFENYAGPVPTNAKKGDTVAYIQYSEHPIKVNNKELHIVAFKNVIATIKEKK